MKPTWKAARRAQRQRAWQHLTRSFATPLAAQLASIELLRDGLDNCPYEIERELLTNVERGCAGLDATDR